MARRGRPPHPDVLTPREREVLALLREGLSNEAIAQRLGVTLADAKYHVSEILGKLGVSTREEAARWREGERPWWASAAAPLSFLWRRTSAGWLSRATAGALAVGVAAGVSLLAWGLVRTEGDRAADRDGALSPPTSVSGFEAGPIELGAGIIGGFDWSADGRAVAFVVQNVLYRADAPDFRPQALVRPVSDLEGPMGGPRWSPDGERIGYAGEHPGRGGAVDDSSMTLWVVNADGSNARDLLPGDEAELSPSTAKNLQGWLDDRTLAFDEHCGTACQVPYLLDVETGAVQQIVRVPGSTTGALGAGILGTVYHWSPDQRYVAVEDMSLPTVLVYHRSTSEITRLALEPPRQGPWQWFDAWAPDSSRFLYEQTTSDGSRPIPPFSLYLWHVERAESRHLATPGKMAAWSHDGSLIAYVTSATAERPCGDRGAETACIAVMNVDTGAELYRVPGPAAAALDGHQDGRSLMFLPDGRLLYAAQGELRIAHEGLVEMLAEFPQIVRFEVSPDGRFAVVAEPLRLSVLRIPPA